MAGTAIIIIITNFNEVRIFRKIEFDSMEWPSVAFKVLIVMSSLLLFARMTSSIAINYVKPFAHKTASPCSDIQRPCLTLNEYASDLGMYFVNNTILYFHPGIHNLDENLVLENLYNFSFQSWPRSDQVVNITVGSLAGISFKGSYNVKISSVSFVLNDDFTLKVCCEACSFTISVAV